MTKKYLIVAAILIADWFSGVAQVKQNVVIEHFTNSRCSICASRNPGLYNNLKNAPEVMHIAVHPSSPYSSCKLNQHNVTENDNRTKYYGVYGSTPRVVVQGEAKSVGVDFTSKDLYSSYQGKTTPVDVKLTTQKKGGDSLSVRIAIYTRASHSLSDMRLYVVAVEDTLFYKSPNGEDKHYDVFRKVMLDQDVTIPSGVGDSVVVFASVENHTDWDASRMYAMAFVQHKSNKRIEQVESSKGDADTDGGTVSVSSVPNETFKVFPNPINDLLYIEIPGQKEYVLSLSGLDGSSFLEKRLTGNSSVNVAGLSSGVYILRLTGSDGIDARRIVKY